MAKNFKSNSSKEDEKIEAEESNVSTDNFLELEKVPVENIDDSRSSEVIVEKVEEPQQEQKRQRLALFFKRYVLSRPYHNIAKTFNKIYEPNSIVMDDEIIDELLAKNAPVGIFERVD